jgi:hypothetical protein
VGSDPRYFKMISGLKHYACRFNSQFSNCVDSCANNDMLVLDAGYSVEDNRAGRIFNVSTFDLFDTYLAQCTAAFDCIGASPCFLTVCWLAVADKMGFDPAQGNAQAVMCSYAGATAAGLIESHRTSWDRFLMLRLNLVWRRCQRRAVVRQRLPYQQGCARALEAR